MHTFSREKFIFHHNGGFDGDVIITDRETKQEMSVPFDDLKALVADYVRTARISELEQADDDVIIGVPGMTFDEYRQRYQEPRRLKERTS